VKKRGDPKGPISQKKEEVVILPAKKRGRILERGGHGDDLIVPRERELTPYNCALGERGRAESSFTKRRKGGKCQIDATEGKGV